MMTISMIDDDDGHDRRRRRHHHRLHRHVGGKFYLVHAARAL